MRKGEIHEFEATYSGKEKIGFCTKWGIVIDSVSSCTWFCFYFHVSTHPQLSSSRIILCSIVFDSVTVYLQKLNHANIRVTRSFFFLVRLESVGVKGRGWERKGFQGGEEKRVWVWKKG